MSATADAQVVARAVTDVRRRIAAAARAAGRDPGSVRLVAATKTVPDGVVRAAVAAGVHDLGENRAQELLGRIDALDDLAPIVRWHFVGRLQRNKVRALAPSVHCWHSVDRQELGTEIARHAPGAHVLVQVNLGREDRKGGCLPEHAGALVDRLREAGLAVDGLMTVPPHDDEPRRWFAALRQLAARLGLPELSMGMTEDYEAAVEEGATMVRVGRALFGARP